MPHTIVPFISIKKAKKDATFSIDEDFRNDSSDRKVNLSVGAYKSEEGKAVILKSVKQAEQKVLEGETNKDYLPMSGLKSFTEGARQVLFSGSVESSKIASIQTLSGTGALRVGFEFLAGFGRKVAYVPQQTWANHHAIIKAAGLELREYKYLDTENMRLDFEGMMDDLRMAPAGSVVVLHMCGHNPTGQDLNEREWEEVHALMEERSLLPFFDAAYQGFTSGDLDRDAYSLRLFASAGPTELLVAQSFSKNMGLYGERAGCLHIVVPDEAATVPVHSQASLVARRIWSNPPMHGAKIAAEIFSNDDLLRLWKSEVEEMAERMNKMRRLLVSNLEKHCTFREWSFLSGQSGMFAYTGLDAKVCKELMRSYHVYLLLTGRISLSGLTEKNVEYVAKSIAQAYDVVFNKNSQ